MSRDEYVSLYPESKSDFQEIKVFSKFGCIGVIPEQYYDQINLTDVIVCKASSIIATGSGKLGCRILIKSRIAEKEHEVKPELRSRAREKHYFPMVSVSGYHRKDGKYINGYSRGRDSNAGYREYLADIEKEERYL